MPRIELQYIPGLPLMSAERIILLNSFYSNFDNNNAAHRRIINVEPLYYQGVIAATEFLVYNVSKLYICFNIQFSGLGAGGAVGYGELYNELNALSMTVSNQSFALTAADVNTFSYNNSIFYDTFFSRIAVANITYMNFKGYRITLN